MTWDCDCCGDRRETTAEAFGQYEDILRGFAVLDDDALQELQALREELGVSKADHDGLVAKYAPARKALSVGLSVDEATLTGFVAGTAGFVRMQVRNGGDRMLRNLVVRYAVSGEEAMREHTTKMLRATAPDEFGAMIELARRGQLMLEFVVRAEDMAGKTQQAFRAEPVGFTVGEAGAATGPSTLVLHTHVQADGMRTAVDPLATVNVGGGGAGVGATKGGALSGRAWRELKLVPMAPDEWVQWALKRDAKLRAEAQGKREAEERAEAEVRVKRDAEPSWRKPWMMSCGQDQYGAWAVARIAGVEVKFRFCPPGRFMMGSPETEEDHLDDEGPQHEVELTRGLWLGETLVTQRLWQAVMGSNPSCFEGEERPVECVSWDDCTGFLGKANGTQPGLDLRLPTEAEWEYACRAGTTGPTYRRVARSVRRAHRALRRTHGHPPRRVRRPDSSGLRWRILRRGGEVLPQLFLGRVQRQPQSVQGRDDRGVARGEGGRPVGAEQR